MKFNSLIMFVGLIVAAGLVGGAVIYQGTRGKPDAAGGPKVGDTKKPSVAIPRVRFTDITTKAGIHFKHENGSAGRKLLPETMGSGCAFFDFDNDGRPDLLLINSRPWPGDAAEKLLPTMALYRNNGDGTFEDVTEKMGLNVPLFGMGVCVGDYDNDGWTDIFVTALGGCKLFRNDGGKRFVDVTAEAGVGGPAEWPEHLSREAFLKLDRPIAWPTSATFVDYDGDGRLDLFVCHYLTWSPARDVNSDFQLKDVGRAFGPPKEFDGTQCVLYHNIDGKRFEDVSAQAGVQVFGPGERGSALGVAKALGVVVCDLDDDGWPDLVVANDTVRNFFFHNVPGPNGTRRFEEKGLSAGLAFAETGARGGMGIDWGEYRPGNSAVVIANFADEPCTFLGQDQSKRLLFADAAAAVGISRASSGPLKFGTFFFDFDLDGRLDLLINNGHLEPEIEKVRGGQKFAQSPQLFWNTGQPGICYESASANDVGDDLFHPLVGRGAAFADIDGDGDLDVVLTANGGAPRLLRNDCDLRHHWVRLRLEGDGKRSNRSAIGAMVTLEAGGHVQRRIVAGARGYLSQSEFPLTFGLGKTEKIDKITIRWPGHAAGPDTVLTDVAVDQLHVVKQGN
jgi:hypothetical protein